VEDLRYRNRYHPIDVEQKSLALAAVLNEVTTGRFGDAGVFEPFINTIRHGDYYLIADDFDSCE
jgi:starch phosphorylase